MEQMMALLLDEIRIIQAKADANLKEMKEDMETNQEMLATMEAKTDPNLMIIAEMKAW
jgi:hypothetical protein